MVKVLIKAKGRDIGDKIMAITRKCLELAPDFPCFGWEFFKSGDKLYFTASYRDGDETGHFEFPISSVCVDKDKEILRELDELKWSCLFWKKEGHE